MRGSEVSVILPTHNRRGLLRRALASVLAQSCLPGEIRIVDDGSTDGTREALEAELRRLSPPVEVRYTRQEQAGVSAARNRGIREAKGEWLAFLDSDDEWRPEKLRRQIEALGHDDPFRVCHTDEIWIRRGRRVNPGRRHAKRGGWIFRHCLALCAISPSSVLLHREVLETVGLFDETLPACEDYDLWLRVCARFPVLLVPDPLVVKHGGHEDQLSRRYWGMDRFRIRALEKILEGGDLSAEDARAAGETLLEKIEIYMNGVVKRGRLREAEELESRRRRAAELVPGLEVAAR